MLKFAFNLLDDGLGGAADSLGRPPSGLHDRRGRRGRDAFLEKRDPDWSRFPRYFMVVHGPPVPEDTRT